MKDSNLRAFGRWICNKSFANVLNQVGSQNKFNVFYKDIMSAINTYFPLRKQTVRFCDKPWVSNKLQRFVSKRQASLAKFGKHANSFKFWRNKFQTELKSCKQTYYHNQVHNIKDRDISKWWKEVKKLGFRPGQRDWCEQLLGESVNTLNVLAENINNFLSIYRLLSTSL